MKRNRKCILEGLAVMLILTACAAAQAETAAGRSFLARPKLWEPAGRNVLSNEPAAGFGGGLAREEPPGQVTDHFDWISDLYEAVERYPDLDY